MISPKCLVPLLLPVVCLSAPQPSKDGQELSRVYHKMMDTYDSALIPINDDGRPLKVNFGVAPVCFELTADGILKGELWLRWTWKDKRLRVNTELNNVKVNPSLLWKPDITLYNRADLWNPQFPEGEEQSNVLVYPSSGEVLWVPPVFQQARCMSDLDDFWGEQTCSLKYGSWTYDGLMVDPVFYNGKEYVDLDDYSENCPVKVLRSTAVKEIKHYDCCEEPYPSLTFNVTMQRQYVVTEHGILRNPRLHNL